MPPFLQLRPKWSLSSIAIPTPVSLPPVTSLYVAPPFLSVPPALCSFVYALSLPLLLSPPLSPTLSRRLFVPLTQTHTTQIMEDSASFGATSYNTTYASCNTLCNTGSNHELIHRTMSRGSPSTHLLRNIFCNNGACVYMYVWRRVGPYASVHHTNMHVYTYT